MPPYSSRLSRTLLRCVLSHRVTLPPINIVIPAAPGGGEPAAKPEDTDLGASWGSGKYASEMQVHPAPAGVGGDQASIKEDPDYLVVDISKFPIEDFDDSNFESKSPADWIETGCKAQSPLYLNQSWKWMPCRYGKGITSA